MTSASLRAFFAQQGQPVTTEDDVAWEYCCRLAEVTSHDANDDVAGLTDLLNDLIAQSTSQGIAVDGSLLSAAQVSSWLRSLHDPSQASTALASGAPQTPPPSATAAETASEPQAAEHTPKTRAASTAASPPPPAAAYSKHTWNVAAAAFVPAPSANPAPAASSCQAMDPRSGQPTDASSAQDCLCIDSLSLGNRVGHPADTREWGDTRGADDPSDAAEWEGPHGGDDPYDAAEWEGTRSAEDYGVGGWDGVPGGQESAWQWQHSAGYDPGWQGGPSMDSCSWTDTEAVREGEDLDPAQLLSAMFPTYDAAMLAQLLSVHGSDLQATVQELLMLDSMADEQVSTAAVATANTSAPAVSPTGMASCHTAMTSIGDRNAPAASVSGSPCTGHRPPTAAAPGARHKPVLTESVNSDTAFPVLGSRGPGTHQAPTAPTTNSWAQVTSVGTTTSGSHSSSGRPAGSSTSGQQPRASVATQRQLGGSAAGQRSTAGPQHSVPRVATGSALSAQYQDARQEASNWARARNACFQQATQAYLAGNKALARELSARGKQYAEKMWSAHELAAQGLMDIRNAVRSVPGGPLCLDLHGLHITEALSVLHQHLPSRVHGSGHGSAAQTQLHVVVGVGKHSKTAGAKPVGRLLTAVQQELVRLGYRWQEPRPGLLVVSL